MSRRSHLKRKSSPAGQLQRLEIRLSNYEPEIQKGGAGTQHHNRPGSLNPRKSH